MRKQLGLLAIFDNDGTICDTQAVEALGRNGTGCGWDSKNEAKHALDEHAATSRK